MTEDWSLAASRWGAADMFCVAKGGVLAGAVVLSRASASSFEEAIVIVVAREKHCLGNWTAKITKNINDLGVIQVFQQSLTRK
jgi:hypothetical protein